MFVGVPRVSVQEDPRCVGVFAGIPAGGCAAQLVGCSADGVGVWAALQRGWQSDASRA